ncbi:type III pantothenate kinase [Mycoplasma testudineum]|uniref:Type III pantothenate kinase n=1 Tax=Mycoplasma testudineum TaxID=244584 RepID=A0A4R6IC72_9MOLU|nr:type III pantothenate kinase [Mycoplasma testudineum]OYD26712.1 hypothetical protein CG473_02840 [Mycoplasma testudineum]TDO19843.1 type III pantothenate kinase [Mycoplasma testudineum]
MNLNLYIDVGNTNVKFAIFKDDKIKVAKLKTNLLDSHTTIFNFIKTYFGLSNFEYLIISSVVPSYDILLKELNQEHFNSKMIFLNSSSKMNLEISPKAKDTIGADILANAIYAARNFEKAIVVSLGTATVISYINNSKLIGTSISPGFYTSFKNLTKNAAKLSQVSLSDKDIIYGQNTQEALSIGFIKGFSYLIKGIANEMDKSAPILLTGGDSMFFKNNFPSAIFVDNMVLEGLKIYYEK